MIQKKTLLIPIDRCGVWWVKTIHLYLGWFRKVSYTNDFIKVSVKLTKPLNKLKKKTKSVGIIIRTKKEILKNDGSLLCFNANNLILLKKRMTPRGKELFGPAIWILRKKKFRASFSGIL